MSSPFRKLADYTPGELLADLKVAEFIKELALGIAEAQKALDENSIAQALELATTPIPGLNKTLIELGLSPPFYHFQYADLEVNMSLTMRVQEELGVDLGVTYSSSSSSGMESTDENVGTAELTVTQDEASKAKAVLEIKENEEGQVKLAGKTVKLATSPGSGDAQLAGNLSTSAKNLAEALEALEDDGGDPILESPVQIDLISDGDVTVSSTSRGVSISRTNVTVLDEDASNAKAWIGFSVADGAHIKYSLDLGTTSVVSNILIGFDESSPSTTLPDLTVDPTGEEDERAEALVALINATSGAEVSAELLAVAKEFVKTITFDFDDATVIRSSDSPAVKEAKLALLKSVIDLMEADPSLEILVQGHTDTTGEPPYNLNLGLSRANNVRDKLIELGAPSSRLKTESQGEDQPLDEDDYPNDTVYDAACRRVEFHLQKVDYRCVMILTSDDTGTATDDLVFDTDDEEDFELLTSEDGEGERRIQVGDIVVVNGVNITAAASSGANQFEVTAGDPEETAEALADAISGSATPALEDVSAVASGATVAVSGEGATVLLTLTTTKTGAAASNTTLSASDSVRVSKPFSAGKDAKAPQPGDTVTVGSKVFAVADPDDPDAIPSGADATFSLGDDAEETARSLAAKINDVLEGSFSAAVSGNKVTIAGKAGTALAVDSETDAFKLSSKVIGGTKEVKSVKANKAKAFGASLDVHYSKKYDLSMSGNSSIKARLVAIPAPADLLDEIKAYLSTE